MNIRKNKKGFTIIELLVTISLMLSILLIAIVSLVGITNKKKTDAEKLVKEQIETAAIEYFNSNEYLFSNIKGDAFGTISVGKLVKEDYLNKVTNPKTGKSIGNCAIVLVKRKSNNSFTSNVDDDSFENATDTETKSRLTKVCDSVVVSNSEAELSNDKITYYDENYKKVTEKRYKDLSDKSKLWFNSKHLGINKNLIACMEDDFTATKRNGLELMVKKNNDHGYCTTIENGTNEEITYALKDKSWSQTITERVDTTPPIVSNLKVESENSYIAGKDLSEIKEYREKFYSFKLTSINETKSIFTYDDESASIKRAKESCYTVPGHGRCYEYDNGQNSHDSEDIFVDGKLMMLKSKDEFGFPYKKINDILPNLSDGGVYLISDPNELELPSDVNNYYNWGSNIYYKDSNKNIDEQKVKNEHVINKETRKVYSYEGYRYIYYTNQRLFCMINMQIYGGNKNACKKIIEVYPNSLNVSAAGILRTIYSSIPLYSSNRSLIYDKIKPYTLTYVNYNKPINGELTKVSFDYNDNTSKVYSYSLDKKYVKEERRDVKYGDLLASYDSYLTKTLKNLNDLSDIKWDRELYNHTYSTDKKTALTDNGLNEEYNKKVLNAVEITGELKKSENDYIKTKINRNSDSILLEHIYADGELDGSIDKYNLTIIDNAGNEAVSDANYEKYKNCTYTKWTEYSDGTEEYCEDVCNSYGTLVKKTGKIAYLVDELTGEYCPLGKWPPEERNAGVTEERSENDAYCPWTDCTTTKPTPNKPTTSKPSVQKDPDPYETKAYKFDNMEDHCSNKSTITLSECGIDASGAECNLNPKGAYRKYEFTELKCSCTVKNGKVSVTYDDITESDHKSKYAHIFYKTEADCNNKDKDKVKQVCTQKIIGDLDYHGVKWNQGSYNHFSGQGWYNKSYTSKKDVKATNKEACTWACEEKAKKDNLK